MNQTQQEPPSLLPVAYGAWPSPISAEIVSKGSVRRSGPKQIGDHLYWSEARPHEAGRVALVAYDLKTKTVSDVLNAPFSARTRVHEYGGGAWWNDTKGTIFFSNDTDRRVYSLSNAIAVPLTSENHDWRFADGTVHPDGWQVCVREDHSADSEPKNELVQISQAGEVATLISGPDFVSTPRFSPDGACLSWIQWSHPNMAWDETQLYVAAVADDGTLGEHVAVASGSSICGADWLQDGSLVYSDDTTSWWNLYIYDVATRTSKALTALDAAEIGACGWVFGTQRWVEYTEGHLAAVITENAIDRVVTFTSGGESLRELATPFCAISAIAATSDGQLLVQGATPTEGEHCITLDLSTQESIKITEPPLRLDPRWVSQAESIRFSVPSMAQESAAEETAYAFYYPATGPHQGLNGEKPPLVVLGHGGPTSHTTMSLKLKVQYWTSRGFSVVDVNYRGSSGFGTKYRNKLQGNWGICDVQDCIAAAQFLASQGKVDPSRIVIRGGSAGGFTVLAALATSEVFAAGTSLYGVADLTALAEDTHKFEARYLDSLVGPYPERKDLYEQRSPLTMLDGFTTPLLALQGSEDKVVPPAQTEMITDALADRGVPHSYILFEGEQHGFRKSENIIRSLEAELWFYGKILGFTPHDEIEPVEIRGEQ